MDADIVGYIGGLIVAIGLFPQVYKTWKCKSAKDISLTWTLVYLLGLVIMIYYGVLIDNVVIIITVSLEALLLYLLLMMKLSYDR